MGQHDMNGPREVRPRGRHLARRLRGPVFEDEPVQWQPSAVVEAHTGPIPLVDPETRLSRLEAIRDHLAAPDPA